MASSEQQQTTPTARRGSGFQPAHARKFGLLVTQCDPESGAVQSVACLFCRHEGRESKAGRKRKVTANCKEFRLSFRTDQYTQHLLSQHPRSWARYCAASDAERRAFFPAAVGGITGGGITDGAAARVDGVGVVDGAGVDQRKWKAEPPLRPTAPKKSRLSVSSASFSPLPSASPELATPAPAVVTTSKTAAAAPSASDAVGREEESSALAAAPAPKSDAAGPATASAAVEPTQSTRTSASATAALLPPTSPAPAPAARAAQTPTCFDVSKRLVDLVLGGEQVWRPLGCLACELLSAEDPEARAVYRVTVRQPMQLELAVDLAALGLTPRQIAKALTATVTRAGLDPALAASNDAAGDLVRLSTVVSLDALSKLLQRSWGFSVGVRTAERSTDLEVRVRVHSGERVRSVHLMAIPVSERRSADVAAMFRSFERVMSAVFPAWRTHLVGLGSDGDATMGDHVAQFVSCVRQEAPRAVYSAWCGGAQLDIALQQFYGSLLGGAFASSFAALRAYICSQESLVADMGLPPSTTSANPWLDMGRDAKWATDKRVRLRKHLEEEKPLAAPTNAWWVAFFVVHWVSSRSNETTKKLQSKENAAAAQQAALLSEFVEDVVAEFSIRGPVDASDDSDDSDAAASGLVETAPEDTLVFSPQRRYAVAKASVLEFIDDLGVFVRNIVARTEPADLDAVAESVAACLVNLVESLASMTSELQQRSSDATEALPPAFPQELAQLGGREFAALLERHSDQLRVLFNDEDMDMIDQEHQALRRASAKAKEKTLAAGAPTNSSGDGGDDDAAAATFERAWPATELRFPALRSFAGGLATVLATATSSVSAPPDFAGLPRAGSSGAAPHAADFALEGALHAQQFHELQALL